MRKVVVSESVTIDGVFEAETMGQWGYPYASDERDATLKFLDAADTLLYGRTTYDLQAYYWPSMKNNEYGIADRKNSLPKYIVTSRPLNTQWNNSTVINKNIAEEIMKLKQQPGQDILIEGSATLVQSLAQAGLIDEYKLLVHPVIMGSGKRLFKDGMGMTSLKLIESKTLKSGVMLLCYGPVK
jgi:dihydrofolate reductase